MPQNCRTCEHPQRAAIDAELSRNWERSLRAIGAQYGLSKDSLSRHAQSHLPQAAEEYRDIAGQLPKTTEIEPAGIIQTEKSEAEPRQVARIEQEKEPPRELTARERVAELARLMGRGAQ